MKKQINGKSKIQFNMRIYQTTQGRFCTLISPPRFLYGYKKAEGFVIEGEVLSKKILEDYEKAGYAITIINPKVKFLSDGKEFVLDYKSIKPVTSLKINVVTKELLDFLSNNKIPYDAVLLR